GEDQPLPAKRLPQEAYAALRAYEWPGNVRQLANVMERVALLTDSTAVAASALGLTPAAAGAADAPSVPEGGGAVLGDAMFEVERQHLLDALAKCDWNITQAALLLGLPRHTLRYRLDPPRPRP